MTWLLALHVLAGLIVFNYLTMGFLKGADIVDLNYEMDNCFGVLACILAPFAALVCLAYLLMAAGLYFGRWWIGKST